MHKYVVKFLIWEPLLPFVDLMFEFIDPLLASLILLLFTELFLSVCVCVIVAQYMQIDVVF